MEHPRPLGVWRATAYATAALVAFTVIACFAANAALVMTRPPSKVDTVLALRKDGVHAYPAVTPQIILLRRDFHGLPTSSGTELLPLGGIAKRKTVFCREGGDLVTYASDRYGFRNDDRLWDEPVDVALVGDSFTQGACVQDDQHFAGQLRRTIPRTLNLGSFGNGPLANLGVIEEYLVDRRPKDVFWLYVANDLAIDLPLERGSPILRSYLRPGFRQGLATRQAEIDAALAGFLDDEIAHLADEEKGTGAGTLGDLRTWLKRRIDLALRPSPPDEPAAFDYDRQDKLDYAMHAVVVAAAAQRVHEAGGRFVFVIVPDARMFRRTPSVGHEPARHLTKLTASIRALGIPVVDLSTAIGAAPDPMALYEPLGGYYGHFNPAGYALAAKALQQAVAGH